MSTICCARGAERLPGTVNQAMTRPLSYSPQITSAAPDRLLASSAAASPPISEGHSTVRTAASPASRNSPSIVARSLPTTLNP